jgi:hypothetical protein
MINTSITEDDGEQVALKISSLGSSDTSEDDINRKELLWEDRQERLIRSWVADMENKSKKHYIAGKKFKKMSELITLPSIIIPVVSSGLTQLIQPYPYAATGLMLTVGILNGINGFFNYSGKKEKHFNYEALYGGLATTINKEMCKPKSMRIACDVYLEYVSIEKNKLDSSAPLL